MKGGHTRERSRKIIIVVLLYCYMMYTEFYRKEAGKTKSSRM